MVVSVFSIERDFARQVKKRIRAVPPSAVIRESLVTWVKETYSQYGRELPASLLNSIADPSVPLVEVAHDGQLPHLGIARLVLKTAQIAGLAGGVALYLIGDHYSAAMRPRNVFLGIPLRGKNPDEVKKPIRLPINGADRRRPFMFLPSPAAEELERLRAKTWHWYEMNIAYEREQGCQMLGVEELGDRVSSWFESLATESVRARSMGDWLIRVQLRLLESVLSGTPLPLVVLPMSGFRRVIGAQLKDALVGSLHEEHPEGHGIWMFCPLCRIRGHPTLAGERVTLRCEHCATTAEEPLDPTSLNQFPDVVTFEVGALELFSGWVVGSQARYLEDVDVIFERRTSSKPPPRYTLSSVPRFRGIGDPLPGYGRSRLLRVLFEMDGPELCTPLLSPLAEDPSIRSRFLG